MSDVRGKPSRPFGVTLAIILSVVFFSITPAIAVLSRAALEQHLSQTYVLVMPDGSEVTGVTQVDEDYRLSPDTIRLQVIISIGFIVLAVFAWRGQPAVMRYLFMVAVLCIAGVLLYQNFTVFQTRALEGGSAAGFFNFIRNANMIFVILVPIYVVWYLNRAPARAFYRGYYLQEEIEWLEDQARET